MSNMSYCKFQNTVSDLADCYESLTDLDLSQQENDARMRLIELAYAIVNDVDMEGGLEAFKEIIVKHQKDENNE